MPVLIIALVLIATVAGIAYLYSTSKPQTPGNTSTTASNTSRTPSVPANAPPGASPVYAIGQPTAAVTIEEFADFQCPSCAVAHPVMKDLQSAYAGNKNVRFVFRHLPLGMHDKAYDAATVVEAAGMQGVPKFWAMLDRMMSGQQTWANSGNYREIWRGYAEKIGLDVPKWESDAAGLGTKGRIDLDIQRARALGVSSTPSVYINNKLIPFADVNVSTMKQLIDSEIEATTKASAPANSAAGTNAAAANQTVNTSK